MQALKYFLVLLLLTVLWSCKKDKSNYLYQEQPQLPPLTPSTVRLMNMGRTATELIINDTPLTSQRPPNIEGGYLGSETRATIYFQNGRLGSSYAIPQRFIRPDGTAHIKIGSMMFGNAGLVYPKEFDIQEDVNNPKDYYNVLFGPHNSIGLLLTDSLIAVPRSVSPPANPQNFKIRILNLSSGPDGAGLEGNMSLVLADGTPVNALTSNVAPGTYSEYVEMPYGTFQFKVLTTKGQVVPAVPVNPEDQLKDVNPVTGTMTQGSNPATDKWSTYAPTRTFQPGGVYTIMISANVAFQYYPPGNTTSSPATLNSFRIIADTKEPVNISYGRVQGVNAMPGVKASIMVDNISLQEGTLACGMTSAYSILLKGNHTITVNDDTGKKLGEQTLTINGSDNYTAWLYPDTNGKPVLMLVANNLSGSFYSGTNGDDGSNNQYSLTMPFWLRFLNLSTDIPEVTFTEANGGLFAGYLAYNSLGSQHLKQGQVVTQQPYVQFSPLIGLNKVNVYASQPTVLPGDWIIDIPSLKGTDFIARTALYPGNKPAFETGIYTVALIGSLHPKNATDLPAKMIIVKHNQ